MTGVEEPWWQGVLVSGGTDGSLVIWQIPDSRQDPEENYFDTNSGCLGEQSAVWDGCHENQPIWDLKMNANGNMISVGSDSSVGLWRVPTLEDVTQGAQALQEPTNYMLGRFRKSGDLGHFLTPTSTCWLPGDRNFAVSYSEAMLAIFDSETGKQI